MNVYDAKARYELTSECGSKRDREEMKLAFYRNYVIAFVWYITRKHTLQQDVVIIFHTHDK